METETRPAPTTATGWLRRLVPLAVLLAVLAAFFGLGLDKDAVERLLRTHRAAIQDFVARDIVLALLAYGVGYTVVVAASLPVATLATLIGGFLFGALLGTAATVVGATAGATILFLVARSAFGEALRVKARPYIGRMEAGFRRNEASYLLFLRLLPVFPFFVVNLVPSVLGVATRTFVLTTFFGIVPGTAAYALVGAGLGRVLDSGEPIDLAAVIGPEIVIGLSVMAVLALTPVLLRRLKRGKSGA